MTRSGPVLPRWPLDLVGILRQVGEAVGRAQGDVHRQLQVPRGACVPGEGVESRWNEVRVYVETWVHKRRVWRGRNEEFMPMPGEGMGAKRQPNAFSPYV